MTDAADATAQGSPRDTGVVDRPGSELPASDLLDRAPDSLLRLVARLPAGLVHRVVAVYRRAHQARLVGVSAEVGFFFALAIVPTIVAVLAVAGAFETLVTTAGQVDIRGTLTRLTRLTFAGDAEADVLDALDVLFATSRPGLFSFSILLVLFLASRGFAGLLRGLRVMYGTTGTRPWWHDRVVAVAFTVLAVIVAAFAVVAFVVGPLLGRGLELADAFGIGTEFLAFWSVARWIVVPLGLIALLAGIYHYARGGHGRWVRDLPGAVVAAVLLVATVMGYRIYLVAGATGGAATAVLGGAFATLVLLAAFAGVLLLGGAYNAENDPDVPDVEDPTLDALAAAAADEGGQTA